MDVQDDPQFGLIEQWIIKCMDLDEDLWENEQEEAASVEGAGKDVLSAGSSPLHVLKSLFPDMNENDLMEELEESGYDFMSLLEKYHADKVVLVEEEVEKPKRKQMCRHFLAGHCARKDCWFSHQLETRVCKYFMSPTGCLNGNCPFVHDFSSLSNFSNQTSSMDSAQSQEPVEEYPALPSVQTTKRPTQPQNMMITKQGKKQILDIWSTPTAPVIVKPISNYASIAKSAPQHSPQRQPEKEKPVYAEVTPKQRKIKVTLDYLDTGTHVSSLYKEYRLEAVKVAKQRNAYFEKAKEAYLAGKYSSAREFSALGHKLNEKMQQLHRAASERIFHERNKDLCDKHDIGMVDLHGLHPEEAIHYTLERLQTFKRTMPYEKVYAITGSGNHSVGRAKVLPQLKQALMEEGYSVREGTLNDGKGGLLVITLRK